MKKISNSLVLACAVFSLACSSTSVYACSQDTAGFMTGGACSIKELKNLEKTKNLQERKKSQSDIERNLRPVRQIPNEQKIINKNCLFGKCFYRQILDRESM